MGFNGIYIVDFMFFNQVETCDLFVIYWDFSKKHGDLLEFHQQLWYNRTLARKNEGFSGDLTLREMTYWCVLRRVAGWVAGGCWDDDITSDLLVMTGIIPENSLRLAPVRWWYDLGVC